MDTAARPLSSIGIDVGKEVFHVVGIGTDGKIAFRRKIKRLALVETFRRWGPVVGHTVFVPGSWLIEENGCA
jgi:transposase